jgi:hypothetical protein
LAYGARILALLEAEPALEPGTRNERAAATDRPLEQGIAVRVTT